MAQPELTTVPKVKDYLRQPAMRQDAEPVIQDYITIASRLVRRYTRRRFTSPVEVGVTREFRTYGRPFVYVDELLSKQDITSVTDENGVSLIYDADFEEHDFPIRGATISVDEAATYGGPHLPPDHADNFIRELRWSGSKPLIPKAIRVTGRFGYSEIPPEIEFAARRAVALWFKEEIAHYTDDAFISRGRIFEPQELPPITIAMLRAWVPESEAVVF